MGNKLLYEEKMLREPSSSISNNQDVQSGGAKVNPRKAKLKYFDPAVFPTLSYGIVCQSGGDISPR